MRHKLTNSLSHVIPAQFCTSLKSVSRVAEEVRQLSDDLGLEEVVEGMRKCGNRGAADQAKDTVSTLLSSVGQNLENLLDQYIDSAIDQVMLYNHQEITSYYSLFSYLQKFKFYVTK